MRATSAIDQLLAAARAALDRVLPRDLPAEIAGGGLVVDIRPVEQRQRDGELAGAVIIDRNVLEWRLDPSSPDHIPEVADTGQRVIIVCNEGYSSSLAAATLRELGLRRATDLAGGYQAWIAAQTADSSDERGAAPGPRTSPRAPHTTARSAPGNESNEN